MPPRLSKRQQREQGELSALAQHSDGAGEFSEDDQPNLLSKPQFVAGFSAVRDRDITPLSKLIEYLARLQLSMPEEPSDDESEDIARPTKTRKVSDRFVTSESCPTANHYSQRERRRNLLSRRANPSLQSPLWDRISTPSYHHLHMSLRRHRGMRRRRLGNRRPKKRKPIRTTLIKSLRSFPSSTPVLFLVSTPASIISRNQIP